MLEYFCNKIGGLQAWNFIAKRLQHRCFPVNIAKSLRTTFLQNNSGWLVLKDESENIFRWWLTYSLQEEHRNSYFEKHLSVLLTVNRKRNVDVQSVLSRELYAVPLDLFYLNGAVRHTAKINLLNEIDIKRSSWPSLREILIMVQLLLISWQYYNLFIATSSKDFQM